MPKLFIDNRPVEVPEGATILDAARKLGIPIPTMCFLAGRRAMTSCMVCVVRIAGQGKFVPSCAAPAVEGQRVESETSEVHESRRRALELLLSDHLGDCQAPCQVACPAHMNIPRMIRLLRTDRPGEAVEVVRRHIALPATLGRICPAPCEKACRRGVKDAPLAICLLKRHAADADLASASPRLPACAPDSGKAVAVIGAGPTGLAAAFHLRQFGHAVTVFERHGRAGGRLRTDVPAGRLPAEILDAEIDFIRRLGADIRPGEPVAPDAPLTELRSRFDAALVACGEAPPERRERFGLDLTDKGVRVDVATFETSGPGVFAAGGAVAPLRMAVRGVAQGRSAALSIHAYLATGQARGEPPSFSTHVGRPADDEIDRFMVEADPAARLGGAEPWAAPLAPAQVPAEAARCMHCDCRKADDCKLRTYSQLYDARASRYKGERPPFEQVRQHPDVLYEPGKCIRCGLCVQIAADAGEELGLTHIGRGFVVRIAVPFDESLAAGLRKAAADCVRACPTGALAFREADGPKTSTTS